MVNGLRECRGVELALEGSGSVHERRLQVPAFDESHAVFRPVMWSGQGSPYSEAIVPIINDFTAAVELSDRETATIAAIGNATMAAASGLTPDDYLAVAAVVDLAVSSSITWHAHQDWGPTGEWCDPMAYTVCPDQPYSVMQSIWKKAAVVIGLDVLGCATAVVGHWYTAATGQAPVVCAIFGIGASASAALTFILAS